MNTNILRQLLAVCPEFYTQTWSNSKIVIDVPAGASIVKEETRAHRKKVIEERLLARTIVVHRDFCETKGLREGDVLAD